MAKKKNKLKFLEGHKIYSVASNSINDNTIDSISAANRERCEEVFHPLKEWDAVAWALAIGNEAGELQGWVKKKYLRKNDISMKEIENEVADVYLYLDLFCSRLGINLLDCVINKFNEVSKKKKSKIRLSR